MFLSKLDIQHDSTHKAMPIPPPIHKEAHPFFAPFRCMAYNKVTRIRQPINLVNNLIKFFRGNLTNILISIFIIIVSDINLPEAPMGCPREMAPPLTLTLSVFRPSSLTHAND